MNLIRKLIDSFKRDSWNSDPFTKMLAIKDDNREQLIVFVLEALRELDGAATFFDAALSHLTEGEFDTAITAALDKLSDGESRAAESVIEYASVQLPHLLTPHLETIAKRRPNQGSYTEHWPWRAAEPSAIENLGIQVGAGNDDSLTAWQRLLEMRTPEATSAASKLFPNVSDQMTGRTFEALSHNVGFEVDDTEIRKLFSDKCAHITFDANFLAEIDRPSWCSPVHHPTWNLESAVLYETRFGGTLDTSCGICQQPLHHLMTLPAGIQTSCELALATCLSCLGNERPRLFYKHEASGAPTSLDISGERVTHESPAPALRETTVRLVETPLRWAFQDWALSNRRENLNRVGGPPSWIQSADYPKCPRCQKSMPFLLQLDSELPTEDGFGWEWGSGGIGYGFWCESCRVSGFTWQCT